MKILAICGSLAANSYNLKFLQALTELIPEEHDYEVVTLHEVPMYQPDLKSEPQAVATLCSKIKAADRVIIGTPEYNYSIPGVLKNALDWISRNLEKPFDGKKTAIMGASPGKIGTARCQYHLRQVGVFLNISFLNKPEVMIGECQNKIDQEGRITDQATAAHLKTMIAALMQA